jgi:hypothetical protein
MSSQMTAGNWVLSTSKMGQGSSFSLHRYGLWHFGSTMKSLTRSCLRLYPLRTTGSNSNFLDAACWLARMLRSYQHMRLRYQPPGDRQNPLKVIGIVAVCLLIGFDLDRVLDDLQSSTMAGNVMRNSVTR